jgi:hypothetical protein
MPPEQQQDEISAIVAMYYEFATPDGVSGVNFTWPCLSVHCNLPAGYPESEPPDLRILSCSGSSSCTEAKMTYMARTAWEAAGKAVCLMDIAESLLTLAEEEKELNTTGQNALSSSEQETKSGTVPGPSLQRQASPGLHLLQESLTSVSDNDNKVTLSVYMMSGTSYKVNVDLSVTKVKELKEELLKQSGIHPWEQRLLAQGMELSDDEVQSLGCAYPPLREEGATLFLVRVEVKGSADYAAYKQLLVFKTRVDKSNLDWEAWANCAACLHKLDENNASWKNYKEAAASEHRYRIRPNDQEMLSHSKFGKFCRFLDREYRKNRYRWAPLDDMVYVQLFVFLVGQGCANQIISQEWDQLLPLHFDAIKRVLFSKTARCRDITLWNSLSFDHGAMQTIPESNFFILKGERLNLDRLRLEPASLKICVMSHREHQKGGFSVERVPFSEHDEVGDDSLLYGVLGPEGKRVIPRQAQEIAVDAICKNFQHENCFRGHACIYFHICIDCYKNNLVAQHPAGADDCWSKIGLVKNI